MSTYQPGEVVDITIKGTRVIEDYGKALVVKMPSQMGTHSFHIPNAAEVEITRVAPAEWPPRVGDLWKDRDGTLWFAVEDNGSQPFRRTGMPYLMCGATDVHPADDVAENWGPLTLVHREETTAICRCGEPGRTEDEMYQCEAADCIAHDYLAVGGALHAGNPRYPNPSMINGGA